ncbi:MAG: hypothetical protein BWY28_00137 [bacterium ADurb.Bin236]|nr:MAG: hypothetical protein BWY28_00137 [bacterium ADurb.Bin236]
MVTNLNADLLDGYHATDFAASAHSHATLTRGTGLTGSNYDGSTATTWAVSYGSAAGTAVQGDTSITITAGTGMSGGGSITLGSGGTVTLNNNDAGSSQFIFKNIADTTPTTQFSATTNNDTIQFAAGGRTTVSFTPASKRVTYTTTLSTLTRGTGLTGSNYDGSAAQTWAVDFGTTATTVAAGNHTHTNMVTGTGTADRVAYWNSASTIASGGLYWDNTNSRLGVAVAPGTYALNVSGTANISGNTTIGGTLGVTGAITGSSTVQGTRLISTVATGTAPLTVASTDLVTNLNADLLDGNHASAFATSGHTHAQLTAGTGILLTAYDGSTARSVSLDKDYTDSFYVLKAGDTMTGTLQGRQLNPTANNTYTLGTSALRYSTAYMVNLNASGTGTVSGLLTLGTQATGTGHAVRADRSITLATSNGILVNGTTSQTQDLTANRTYNLSLDKSHTNCAFTAATTLNVAAQDTSCAAGFCAIAAVDGAAYTTSASAKHDSASLYFNGGVAQIATLRVLCCPCQ